MSRQRHLVGGVCAAICVLVGLLAGPAQAHTSSSYVAPKWARGTTVVWQHTPSTNVGTAFRERIRQGAIQWNGIGTGIWLTKGTDLATTPSVDECDPKMRNLIFRAPIDGAGNTLAYAGSCNWPDGTRAFRIVFDRDDNFYTGTGTPSSTQYDLWSVAAHEFGHAIGYHTHFLESSWVCDFNSGRNTMCPSTFSGTTWQRSLNDHDVHTVVAAY
jgi:hypothetical protein